MSSGHRRVAGFRCFRWLDQKQRSFLGCKRLRLDADRLDEPLAWPHLDLAHRNDQPAVEHQEETIGVARQNRSETRLRLKLLPDPRQDFGAEQLDAFHCVIWI
ncbi:MAG: hypothetical protein ACI9BK_001750 [Acidimicrobiales bacterium]|jgi:hypothetical protein